MNDMEPSLPKLLLIIGICTLVLYLIAGSWFVATSEYSFRIAALAYLRTLPLYLIAYVGVGVGISVLHFIERRRKREK